MSDEQLDELPESLDETYERILEGNQEDEYEAHAQRVLQCLVCRRPATSAMIEELCAEVLAVDFDDEWRLEC